MRLLLIFLSFCCAVRAQIITPLDGHTAESLRGVHAVDDKVVWASGTHGTYLRTVDGGFNWAPAQVPGAEELDFRDVAAFSADEAYLLAAGPGEKSRIYKTSDAGQHWALQFTNNDPKGFYDCFGFWDHDHGIAIGDPVDGRFELLATEDGGAHWTALPQASRPEAKPKEGAFAASGTCLTVEGSSNVWFATGGSVARVFRSRDRGRSWRVVETKMVHGADASGIFSIAFRDAKHGLIAGGDYQNPDTDSPNLAASSDGGATWQILPVHPQFYFSAVNFVGAKSREYLAVGSTHGITGNLKSNELPRIFPVTLNAFSAGGPSKVFAVGPKGTIILILLNGFHKR